MAKQTKRMDGADRKKAILDAGAKLAGKFGAVNVTRKMVAEAAKASPALVAHYIGTTEDAQKAYAKHAKKLGIDQPTKEKIEAIGLKMRAHGPRQAPVKRARSAKEVKAIKTAVAKRTVKVAKVVAAAKAAKPIGTVSKVKVTKTGAKAEVKLNADGRKLAARLSPAKPKVAAKKPSRSAPSAKAVAVGTPANKALLASPAQAIATLPQPVTPVNVPPAKKKPATAARAPLPAPVAPPVAPGNDTLN